MELKVCIGSACHLKGSYDVIEKLKMLVAQNQADIDLELAASFCLGRCGEGVTVCADGEFIDGVTADTVEQIFAQTILPKAKRK